MIKLSDILNEGVKDGVVTCDKCNWQWDISDGGEHPFTCHKCGNDNTPISEDLRKWFGKGKTGGWDRYNSKGEKVGKCGDSEEGSAYAACLSNEKAAKLGKDGRASFVNSILAGLLSCNVPESRPIENTAVSLYNIVVPLEVTSTTVSLPDDGFRLYVPLFHPNGPVMVVPFAIVTTPALSSVTLSSLSCGTKKFVLVV